MISFQFTLKVLATDSDDAPLKESNVVIDEDAGTTTGDDGTTTNNDKKFEFGSKVTITVTKTGYFAMSEEHEFKDSDKTEQEHTIKLAKEGIHPLDYHFHIHMLFFSSKIMERLQIV